MFKMEGMRSNMHNCHQILPSHPVMSPVLHLFPPHNLPFPAEITSTRGSRQTAVTQLAPLAILPLLFQNWNSQ